MRLNLFEDITLEDLSDEQREVAELIGLNKYLEMVELLGGETLYIPKSDCLLRTVRNRLIKEERKAGKSYRFLAKKYHLTKNTIINILSGLSGRA